MPELPEVETVRRQLAGSIAGLTFAAVEQVEPAMLLDCGEAQVRDELPERRIETVDRLGKFLIVPLSSGTTGPAYLTLHLGMTGQLLVDPTDGSAHTRFRFHLHDGHGRRKVLEFRDTRKFGRVHLTLGGPAPRLALLGPDAWLGVWDAAYLRDRLRGRSAPIKAFLLDQRHLSGIGNIYADETLWWSQISPLREGGSLTAEEVTRLAEEIRRRLGEGVRFLGCSLSDFVDTAGREGGFQNWLRLRKAGSAVLSVWWCVRPRDRSGARHVILPPVPAVAGDARERRWEGAEGSSHQVEQKKRAPSGLALRLSSVLTSFPLHCTPRSFVSAFPLRVPL